MLTSQSSYTAHRGQSPFTYRMACYFLFEQNSADLYLKRLTQNFRVTILSLYHHDAIIDSKWGINGMLHTSQLHIHLYTTLAIAQYLTLPELLLCPRQ